LKGYTVYKTNSDGQRESLDFHKSDIKLVSDFWGPEACEEACNAAEDCAGFEVVRYYNDVSGNQVDPSQSYCSFLDALSFNCQEENSKYVSHGVHSWCFKKPGGPEVATEEAAPGGSQEAAASAAAEAAPGRRTTSEDVLAGGSPGAASGTAEDAELAGALAQDAGSGATQDEVPGATSETAAGEAGAATESDIYEAERKAEEAERDRDERRRLEESAESLGSVDVPILGNVDVPKLLALALGCFALLLIAALLVTLHLTGNLSGPGSRGGFQRLGQRPKLGGSSWFAIYAPPPNRGDELVGDY
jgi:hypothetical protein